ncbi:GNAT family N-acetyltransferase [Paenibacillus brevis]|uniref:GNAT family N-acetyltransferase n=1 Tax=Paenibacillus brevis TaxID=2841508 RepID=A0ABS6FX04_9BACL|nr:GNAT family N-acetyltransferase [Paenibacillus brevis]MBU5674765.1 GNAT family N-acetyltransferase [Paenibacillus brevis]
MIVSLSLQDPNIVEQIWRLQHTAYRMEAAAMGLKNVPPLPETFGSLRSSGDLFFGMISEEEELLGAIAVLLSGSPAQVEITRLMIRQDCLRQGIGSRLVEHVLRSFPDVDAFSVTAGTGNVPAVQLYRKFGFEPGETVSSVAGAHLTVFHYRRSY